MTVPRFGWLTRAAHMVHTTKCTVVRAMKVLLVNRFRSTSVELLGGNAAAMFNHPKCIIVVQFD
jgi:hypothetical protein